MCDTTSCDTSKVLFTFEIYTDTFYPNVKEHVSQMWRSTICVKNIKWWNDEILFVIHRMSQIELLQIEGSIKK